jgi:hypothetical protein
MADFVHNATNVFYDEKEQPVAWAANWVATNFDGSTINVPAAGGILKRAYEKGARTLLVDGVGLLYNGAAAGVTVALQIFGDPTNSFGSVCQRQTTIASSDFLEWDAHGFPVTLSAMLSKAVTAYARVTGYAATDDMTLTMWGRFK